MKYSKPKKTIKHPTEQHKSIMKIILALVRCYIISNKIKFYYEKTLTHEFYRQLFKEKPTHKIIPEYPLRKFLPKYKTDKRLDFNLFIEGDSSHKQGIILEFKIDCYKKSDIQKDLDKLSRVYKFYRKDVHSQNILPLFINFFTSPLKFNKYQDIISDICSKSEVDIIAICPSIVDNTLHIKRPGKTKHDIKKICIVTNYQKLIDFKMIPSKIPVILHKKASIAKFNRRISNTLLYGFSGRPMKIE
jgi:hypothetical protein